MKRKLVLFVLLGLSAVGCAGKEKPVLGLVHDEVLTFPLPLDLTYLRTMEAIERHPDWELDTTVKDQGVIYIRNVRYSSFADADQRRATLLVKRVGPKTTSVQLAPESQAVVGAGEVLDLIKQTLAREVSRRN